MSPAKQPVSESGWPTDDVLCLAPCMSTMCLGPVALQSSMSSNKGTSSQPGPAASPKWRREGARQFQAGIQSWAWVKAEYAQTPPCLTRWGRKNYTFTTGQGNDTQRRWGSALCIPDSKAQSHHFALTARSSQSPRLAGHFPEHPYSVQHTCCPHRCSTTLKHLRANEQ